jgi:hypothetical protein
LVRVGVAAFFAVLAYDANGQTTDFVDVRVLADGQTCVVLDRQLTCDVVAAYLRDDRHLAFSHPIAISSDVVGEASVARGSKIGQSLRAAGYSTVYVVGFLTAPGTAPDTEP